MRILQLSDPHLLADPLGRCRGKVALECLRHGLQMALKQLTSMPQQPDQTGPVDLVLITGDLCQDESWGGYARLRDLLTEELLPFGIACALLPGNHDHGQRLAAALGRQALLAPDEVPLGDWRLLLLNSHRPGSLAGWLEPSQLTWLQTLLAQGDGPVLVALHHPPIAIGHPELDAIGLLNSAPLLQVLKDSPRVRAVVFGHIHQHWQGSLTGPLGSVVPLWGCPSTLAAFAAVQPCPLGHPDWPGGRLLELRADGEIGSTLLRWPPLPPTDDYLMGGSGGAAAESETTGLGSVG